MCLLVIIYLISKGDVMRKWCILMALCSLASAQAKELKNSPIHALAPPSSEARAIMPVFSQLVTFSYPKGFMVAFEEAKNGRYIQESVLQGESVEQWTQMITVTGARDLATQADVTPLRFTHGLAAGFQRACPDSYAAKSLGKVTLGGHEGFVSVISCGRVNAAADAHSESMLAIVIKGERDLYTVQWAERGPASQAPLSLDHPVWTARLQQLMPLTLCPKIAGEKPPYPSCLAASSTRTIATSR